MQVTKMPNIVEYFEVHTDDYHYLVSVEHEGDNIVNRIEWRTDTDMGTSPPFSIHGVTLTVIDEVLTKGNFYLPELETPNNTPVQ